MTQVVIENPVLNSPFEEPYRHFHFSEEGINNEIVEARRISSYFIPVPRPKKKSQQQQLSFATEWTEDRLKDNEFINHVRTLDDRISPEITFPRLQGYRYELPGEKLAAHFTDDSKLLLPTQDIPTKTENAPIVGESIILTLDDLKNRRMQEVAFLLAKLTLEKYFYDNDGNAKPWLFPPILSITKRWIDECDILKDNVFPQLLLLTQFAHNATDRIYRAIVAAESGDKTLKPILYPYDPTGSTRYVDLDPTRATYKTDPDKCHISHVVADTDSWEQKMAAALEDMEEVFAYAKNQNLGFNIPYTIDGQEKNYSDK